MIATIFLQELAKNLKLVRWRLFSVLAVVLFIFSAVQFVSFYGRQKEGYDRSQNELRETMASLRSIGETRQTEFLIQKEIHASWSILYGAEKHVPNAARFNMVDEEMLPVYVLARNIFFLSAFHVDWLFIATFCLSLAAILLGHDSITGDIESGVLKLTLVNRVMRASLLLGKASAILTALTIPLVLGVCATLAILKLSGVPIRFEDLWIMAGAAVLTVLLIGLLVMLSMWISVLSQSSSVSLVWGILLWVFLVPLLPGLAKIAAWYASPVEQTRSVEERVDQALQEFQRAAPASPGAFKAFHKTREDLRLENHRRIDRQLAIGLNLEQLSPFAGYRNAVGFLVGAGLAGHQRFMNDAVAHLQRLRDGISTPSATGGQNTAWQDLFEFRQSQSSTWERLLAAAERMMFPIFAGILCFFGCFISFARLPLP